MAKNRIETVTIEGRPIQVRVREQKPIPPFSERLIIQAGRKNLHLVVGPGDNAGAYLNTRYGRFLGRRFLPRTEGETRASCTQARRELERIVAKRGTPLHHSIYTRNGKLRQFMRTHGTEIFGEHEVLEDNEFPPTYFAYTIIKT